MCGIAGAISLQEQFNPDIVRGLMWANRERGTDSLGLFDTSGRILKGAGDPAKLMKRTPYRDWLNHSADNSWAVGIHTRHATQGDVVDKNAHPFKYGHIIGSHNGMVQAPYEYEVDSEYLFDTIAVDGIQGLETVSGYWGLSWYDKKREEFYLTLHNGMLAYAVQNGVCYYSSDIDHLATFCEGAIDMIEGQVLCFSKSGTVLDSQQGQIDSLNVKGSYWNKGYATTGTITTYQPDTNQALEGEQEWRDAWGGYLNALSDEQFAVQDGELWNN